MVAQMPTHGEAVLAVAREIIAFQDRFEGNDYLWNPPDDPQALRSWGEVRMEILSTLHGMHQALALMLGWPKDEGDKEGMVDIFLEQLRESEVDKPDIARMVVEVEDYCRSWRPDIPKRIEGE